MSGQVSISLGSGRFYNILLLIRYFYRRLKTEMFTWYCVESLQWNPCIQFDVKPQTSWFIIKVIVIEVKTDLCNTLQQCVDEWHLGSSSAWHPSSRLSPGPPGPSHCVLQYPADVGSDWGDADQPDYSLHRTIWRESDTRRLTLTLLFRGLRGSCVVIRSGAENVRWRLNTERRNAARTSRLYDNSVLTTAAVWSTLILWGSLSLCFLSDIWTSEEEDVCDDIMRSGRWRHQSLSEEPREFQLEAIRAAVQRRRIAGRQRVHDDKCDTPE